MIMEFFWGLLILLILLIVIAVAVPMSVLIWWAGWRHEATAPANELAPLASAAPVAGPFLIYFSGINDIAGDYQTSFEDELLAAIVERVPGLVTISDVFGFSVNNMSMTSQQSLGWFWTWVSHMRLRKKSPLKKVGMLISMRNMLHVTISADRRYGPIYNYSVAEMALQGLLRHGYRLGSGQPVTLMGYSGGGQIALAIAGYIQATLRVPVQVISLAGVIDSSASIEHISALTHIYGTRDRQVLVGNVVFPARWPIFQGTQWARGLAAGKIHLRCLGPMVHAGRGSYLDATCYVDDGRSFRAVTADCVAELIRKLETVG